MNIWHECSVRHSKRTENGNFIPSTEVFLIDSVSFTDAETKVNQIASKYISGEFDVNKITKSKISDIIPDPKGGFYFKCRIQFESLNESTGKTKKTYTYVLVESEKIEYVPEKINKSFEGMVSDWKLIAVSETPIIDIIYHENQEVDDIKSEDTF